MSTNLGAEEVEAKAAVAKAVECKICSDLVPESSADQCLECKVWLCREGCSTARTEEGIVTSDVYCNLCLLGIKKKKKKKVCDGCHKPGEYIDCGRCSRGSCLNCGVECDTGFRCNFCITYDNDMLTFLVGRAGFDNYKQAVMVYYSRASKRQRGEYRSIVAVKPVDMD
jgi:hypothetical protein